MKRLILTLALCLAALTAQAQTYTAGVTVATLSGSAVSFVPAAPATKIMQCTAAFANSCWPTEAGSIAPSVALSAATWVFAIVPPATSPQWVTVASITASAPAAPPTYIVNWICAATPTPATPTVTRETVANGISFVITGSCAPPATAASVTLKKPSLWQRMFGP